MREQEQEVRRPKAKAPVRRWRNGGQRGPTRRLDYDRVIRTIEKCGGNVAEGVRRLNAKGVRIIYGTARNIWKGRAAEVFEDGRRTRSRFASIPLEGRLRKMLPVDHEALAEKRTVYPKAVTDVVGGEDVLKSGQHNAKIGGVVLKGRWAGMPIFILTLEERATCPTHCRHWGSCMGNKMHLARRFRAGPALEKRIAVEVAYLAGRHPQGFVVRLHQLGDFYSLEYVRLWRALLEQHPALRIFGYTARWDGKRCAISRELVQMSMTMWDRFAMRFSNAPTDECTTVSIEHPIQLPAGALLCPEQLGKSESCSACGLCWEQRKPIAFLQH